MATPVNYFGVVSHYTPSTKIVKFLEQRLVFLDAGCPQDFIQKPYRDGTQVIVLWGTDLNAVKKKTLDYFKR
jgi:hypothetical protein